MSKIFRERSLGSSRGHSIRETIANTITIKPIYAIEEFPSPFGEPALGLSDWELQQTAYEILVAVWRSSAGTALAYIPQSEKTERVTAPLSRQRSLTSTAASRVKKVLGLKSPTRKKMICGDSVSKGGSNRPVTVGELIRVQMKVSEQMDLITRRALIRVASAQLGRGMELMVLPLELLQQFRSSDFSNQQEYKAWHAKNWKVLEAGLLLHPNIPLDKTDDAPKKFRQIMQGALEKPMETGRSGESMQVLRRTVMSLACRSFDGSISYSCHWADGFPLNLRLYDMLLRACFDINEETYIIEEVDKFLELIKKAWPILGINQCLHNLCFLWVLFHHYIASGQVEDDLLFAVNNLLVEVEKDAKAAKDPIYSNTLSNALNLMMGWAENRLLMYHDTFHGGNVDSMQTVVSIGIVAARILGVDSSQDYVDVAHDRVDRYIRSSLRAAFTQELEKVDPGRNLYRDQQNHLPLFAENITKLAFKEKAIYSPMLRRWHPFAAGVAVATLHSCYGNVLKHFLSDVSELTSDAIQVLLAADKLEKDLVQIAVEDSVNSEDGGKSIIKEMTPYETEAIASKLVKSWIKTRVDRLKEWVDRNLQQELWNPRANKERFAPSAVEVLRIVDETLEAFFLLPIPMHAALLPEMIVGLDRCLLHYILMSKHGCGTKNMFIPTMPALTRCRIGSKFDGVFRKKEKSQIARIKSPAVNKNEDSLFGVAQLCVRINSLQRIHTELDVLEKRTITYLKNSDYFHAKIANEMSSKFELSAAGCEEGIKQLSEATGYKVVFHDLSHVLWDSLYVGEVLSSRIEPYLEELECYLEIISSTAHDRVRTRVIADTMKASCDGFLLVLLAGGPSRSFTEKDSEAIEDDFKFLVDLFWSNGDGLPADLLDKYSSPVKDVLPLFGTSTESLVEQFKHLMVKNYICYAKSRIPLPPTPAQWNPMEPNTLLRVLCHRNDETATRFLKKTYNLPKKL